MQGGVFSRHTERRTRRQSLIGFRRNRHVEWVGKDTMWCQNLPSRYEDKKLQNVLRQHENDHFLNKENADPYATSLFNSWRKWNWSRQVSKAISNTPKERKKENGPWESSFCCKLREAVREYGPSVVRSGDRGKIISVNHSASTVDSAADCFSESAESTVCGHNYTSHVQGKSQLSLSLLTSVVILFRKFTISMTTKAVLWVDDIDLWLSD